MKTEVKNMKKEMKQTTQNDLTQLRKEVEEKLKQPPPTVDAGASEQLKNLQKTVEELQTKTRTTVSRGASSNEWQPQFIYVRGFSPQSDKNEIDKQSCQAYCEQFLSKLPDKLKKTCRYVNRFESNYQLTFRVQGGLFVCQDVANAFRDFIETENFKINDRNIFVTIQVSPQMTKWRAKLGQAKDQTVKALGEDAVKACYHGLKLCTQPGLEVLGEVRRDTEVWEWKLEACKKAGFEPTPVA